MGTLCALPLIPGQVPGVPGPLLCPQRLPRPKHSLHLLTAQREVGTVQGRSSPPRGGNQGAIPAISERRNPGVQWGLRGDSNTA